MLFALAIWLRDIDSNITQYYFRQCNAGGRTLNSVTKGAIKGELWAYIRNILEKITHY